MLPAAGITEPCNRPAAGRQLKIEDLKLNIGGILSFKCRT
jgi:hypothetical protein